MQIHNKPEIILALNQRITAFTDHIARLDKDQFESMPANKWSAGQNLDHLIRSIKPLQPAYVIPKFFLAMLFGKANRPSRTYEQLVEKYKMKLAGGGRAVGRFVPRRVEFGEKEKMIILYQNHARRLSKKIHRQQESSLDKYILPHPLLGKLTLREMLFFTIYHNEHHLRILLERGAR